MLLLPFYLTDQKEQRCEGFFVHRYKKLFSCTVIIIFLRFQKIFMSCPQMKPIVPPKRHSEAGKEGLLHWASSKEIYPVPVRQRSERLIYLQRFDIGSPTSQVSFLIAHVCEHLSVTQSTM